MTISNRVAMALVLAVTAALVAALIGWFAVARFGAKELARVELLLTTGLESRRQRVQSFLDEIGNDLDLLSAAGFTQTAIGEFSGALEALDARARTALQRQYVDDNPHPAGRRHALFRARDSGAYGAIHERYHGMFTKLAEARGYHDIFLVSPDGEIAYSVFKERDFLTNLVSGPFKDTELGETFTTIRHDPQPGQIEYRDFKRFRPSNDAPSTFIGVPIFDAGQFVGTCIVQLLAERIDDVMKFNVLMGRTGEAYLVGPDLLMRTRSRFEEQSTVLRIKVETPSTHAALDELSGFGIVRDYRGVEVYSAYAPLEWKGVRWAAIAEMDTAEADADVRALRMAVIAIGALCVLGAAMLGFLLADHDRRH